MDRGDIEDILQILPFKKGKLLVRYLGRSELIASVMASIQVISKEERPRFLGKRLDYFSAQCAWKLCLGTRKFASSSTQVKQRTTCISFCLSNQINIGSSNESSQTRTTATSRPQDVNVTLNLSTTTSPSTIEPNNNHLPLTTPPSRESLPLTNKIKPSQLVFTILPTFPHPFLDCLEDLPPRTSYPPLQPTFESIEHIALHAHYLGFFNMQVFVVR
ncbi:hypothetical protein Tco_1455792 [Tanacetum coccineum]